MKLIICEKPSQGRDIAKALGANQSEEGCIRGTDIVVTWAIGHIFELQNMEEYSPELKQWSFETIPFMPEQFKVSPKKQTFKQWQTIKKLLKSSEIKEVVCATDAGREGQLIFDYCYREAKCKKPSYRLWTASLTPEAIREAWERLRPMEEFLGLSEAAESRALADWTLGINGSRAHTLLGKSKGFKQALSLGRVQTPTLQLIAQRDNEIKNFKPKPFWKIISEFKHPSGVYEGEWFKKVDNKITSQFATKEDAERVIDSLIGQKSTVAVVHSSLKKTHPNKLFDLTSLQKEANIRFQFTSEHTLKIAQSLYEKSKVLSYPRTDSCYLTPDVGARLPEQLQRLSTVENYGELFKHAEITELSKRFQDSSKVTDHHAIIPTGVVPKDLSLDEKKIFDLVFRRTLAAYSRPRQDNILKVVTRVGEETFKTQGNSLLDLGYQAIDAPFSKTKEKLLPQLQKGDAVTGKLELKEGKTTPPKSYTEATLLAAMETCGKQLDDELKEVMKGSGLGTPATRASIIESLKKKGYISQQKNTLVSTPLGQQLLDLLPNELLKSPELTGQWEQKLSFMEKGQLSQSQFLKELKELTENVVNSIKDNANHDALKTTEAREVGSCPQCSSVLVLRASQTGGHFVSCTNKKCKVSYSSNDKGESLGGTCSHCETGILKQTQSGAKVCLSCGKWENPETINLPCPCGKSSVQIRQYKGSSYAKCVGEDCKTSYPTDNKGMPKVKCKSCSGPVSVFPSGAKRCTACGEWQSTRKKKRA